MCPTNLSEVLQPYSAREFLASVWGKTYLFIPGQPGKFAELLLWSQLNTILREHRLDSPQIRVVMNGAGLTPDNYRHFRQTRKGQAVPCLDPVKLQNLLRQGSTLIVDAVDEMVAPIAQLAESLESSLHEPIQVNAYVGCGTSPGFAPHIDHHDVLVLQVTGRKRWMIYGAAAEHALSLNGQSAQPPPAEPVWDHLLEAGDLLYIPRGWWHVALPLSEPTLHLTVGFRTRTGIDFLSWLQEELQSHPIFSQRLPRFARPAEQAEHMERLRTELLAAWDERAFERYLATDDALAAPRPRFSLPWSATPASLPSTDKAFVQWTVPRPVVLRQGAEDQTVEVWANGEKWQFARAAEAVLGPLVDGGPHSIGEICERARETLDRERVRSFLGELVVQGLVAVVDPPQ